MMRSPSNYGPSGGYGRSRGNSREHKKNKDDKKRLKALAGQISEHLRSGQFVEMIKDLDELHGGKKEGKESVTALRKLFETVHAYVQEIDPKDTASVERAAAKMYAAVSHVAARQDKERIQLAKLVADEYLVKGQGPLDERINRFDLFMEVLVSTVG